MPLSFLLWSLLTGAASIGAQETFYVDPAGDDSNPGTAAAPLRTFAGAAAKVRRVLDGSGDVSVLFRSGVYVFEETVVLGPADSGSANQVITYRASSGRHRSSRPWCLSPASRPLAASS